MHVIGNSLTNVHKPTYSRKHYLIKKQHHKDLKNSLRLHTPDQL